MVFQRLEQYTVPSRSFLKDRSDLVHEELYRGIKCSLERALKMLSDRDDPSNDMQMNL